MKRLAWTLAALALAATACAEGESADQDETTTTVATTTTVPETTTTVAETTTTTEPTRQTNEAFDELIDRITNAPVLDSARVEALASVVDLDTAEAGVSEASFSLSGVFDTATESSTYVMDASSLANAMASDPDSPLAGMAGTDAGVLEIRRIGDTAYMRMPILNEVLGIDTAWVSMPAYDGENFTFDFTAPSDPSELLTAYDGADVIVEELGSERVNGVETTHYRLSFDTTAWLGELTVEERAELRESGVFAEGVLMMEIWVTAEGHIVRLLFEIEESEIGSHDESSRIVTKLQYDMFDINEPVTIDKPPASEVTDITDIDDLDFDFEVAA